MIDPAVVLSMLCFIVIFMSGNDSVRAYLFIFVSICIAIEDPVINQLVLGSITLTGLNPPHVCACPKLRPGFQLYMSWISYSMSYGEVIVRFVE